MQEHFLKVCRVCLSEGSRSIFHKNFTHEAFLNVSSINRISEKLRFVTLLKIDENENLPQMICDLCIVQLNVAYNFKKQAADSDTKIRQYLIENGISIQKESRRLLTVPTAAIRNSSVSSSSVYEVASTARVHDVSTPQFCALRPMSIKIETPDVVEQISDPSDLISHSTISPLSSSTTILEPSAPPQPQPPLPTIEPILVADCKEPEPEVSMVTLIPTNIQKTTPHRTDEQFIQNFIPDKSRKSSESKAKQIMHNLHIDMNESVIQKKDDAKLRTRPANLSYVQTRKKQIKIKPEMGLNPMSPAVKKISEERKIKKMLKNLRLGKGRPEIGKPQKKPSSGGGKLKAMKEKIIKKLNIDGKMASKKKTDTKIKMKQRKDKSQNEVKRVIAKDKVAKSKGK